MEMFGIRLKAASVLRKIAWTIYPFPERTEFEYAECMDWAVGLSDYNLDLFLRALMREDQDRYYCNLSPEELEALTAPLFSC